MTQELHVLVERRVFCPTTQISGSMKEIHPFKRSSCAVRDMEERQASAEATHQEEPTSILEGPDR